MAFTYFTCFISVIANVASCKIRLTNQEGKLAMLTLRFNMPFQKGTRGTA